MSSKTLKMRQQEEGIKRLIVQAHAAGLCDAEGRSIDAPDGSTVARPRSLGSTARTFRYDKYGNRIGDN